MTDTISWVATGATIIAASMTASNLGTRITGYGFCIFLVGSLAWLATGVLTGQPALVWTNVVLTFLNMFGIWRWLGRQASVEDGARAAAKASERAPSESLFAVSLLTRGPIDHAGEHVANCVDAMAGRETGRVAYLVVSEGGVAGVGENLRKLPWDSARIEQDRIVAQEFDRLEVLPKDAWPAR